MARWNSCNILQTAADASRLWQFDAKGGGFVLGREQSAAPGGPLPSRSVAKSWNSLWSPRLNVAWLPPEHVFLRVIELPKSSFAETLAMVELQLEKLSPLPVAQIVWTIHVLSALPPQRRGEAETEATTIEFQSVVVIIAARGAVEEFLGKLEGRGYLADRLETPLLDQLEAAPAAGDSAWIYAGTHGKDSALVAWWSGGALRNLSYVILPPEGDRAKSLKNQLVQFLWAGEMEGWLAEPSKWRLVADPVNAAEWEKLFRDGMDAPLEVTQPLPPAELAARTSRRAAAAEAGPALLPPEFSTRYHQQFVDRLWLHGLVSTGILYAIGVVIYFCATYFLSLQTAKAEQQAAQLAGSYTNALELKARYGVLQQRQALKYAALDCWKIAAENLPDGLQLQRTSFADGQRLTLSGVCPPDQITLVSDPGKFYDSVRKSTVDGQDHVRAGARRAAPLEPERQRQQRVLAFHPATQKRGKAEAVKKFFAQLRPLERRLAFGVLVVFVLVLNYVFIWPHFSDWNNLKRRLDTAQMELARDQAAIAEMPKYQALVKQFEGEGEVVPPEDQAINFLRTIQTQAAMSGVGIANMGRQSTSTNDVFFVQLIQNINVSATDEKLVDFLYKLGSSASMIRVLDLELQTDPPRATSRRQRPARRQLPEKIPPPAAPAAAKAAQKAQIPPNQSRKYPQPRRQNENDHDPPPLLMTASGLWAQTPPPPRRRPSRHSRLAALADPAALPVPAPAASAAPPAAAAPVKEVPGIEYTFSGVDANQVLDIYADLIERTQLRCPLPQPSVTLKTHGKLTKTEAIQALQAVLAMNGIIVINISDKFVKEVPLDQAGPAAQNFDYSDATNLPAIGGFVTHIVQVKYVKPSEIDSSPPAVRQIAEFAFRH